MNNFIPEIPMIRCDFSLIGSAKYMYQIEETMQWRNTGQTGDWTISTGNVMCNDTSLVTDIILNLLPKFQWGWINQYQKAYGAEPVLDLKIRCKESCFPFVILDRKIIRFLRDTQTRLRLFALEDGSTSNCQAMRLKLVLKGDAMPFELVEKMTGKNAVFKRRKEEFPEAVQNQTEDCWVYETNKFYTDNLQEIAGSLYSAFSGNINNFINSERSLIEINVYKNNEAEGISLETIIPEALILLAEELGAPLFIGNYLVEK